MNLVQELARTKVEKTLSGFMLSAEALEKLEKAANLIKTSKSSIVEILLKNLDIESIEKQVAEKYGA